MLPHTATVSIDDLSIQYRRAGQGPALILLHGFLCDSRCWRHQLADLSREFDVIAWDAPGAGASSDPPDPFTLGDWSHYLARFLDLLGVDVAHFVGLSWGGVLAQEFYHMYRTRVSRLILADTYAGWKGSLTAPLAEQLRGAIPGAELHVIARAGHVSNMEQPKEFNAQVRRFCLAA